MSGAALKKTKSYTWSDYQGWHDDQRWEIIHGEAYLMSPGPTSRHQWVSMGLSRQMSALFLKKSCRLFAAPMDVVLSEQDVVQPDLLVVCDAARIKRTHVEGAPALVVEILSDSSISRDRLLKLGLYARHEVPEYWIVTPWPSLVEVYRLEAGHYVVHGVFGKADKLISPAFPDLDLILADVFDFPIEPGEEPPVVREPPTPAYAT